MVYINNIYPAKSAFKSNKESKDAGSYISNKTASTISCDRSCNRTTYNYHQLYRLHNNSRQFTKKNIFKPTFDKTDLNINLFTKLDLQNVCVVNNNITQKCASSIDPSSPFYLTYTVDPSGVLFGNTECGINNFENFLVPNPPPLPT